MNYEHVRKLVNEVIDLIDRRLGEDFVSASGETGWVQLESLNFDQTFCDDDDDDDETMVTVKFRWLDVNVKKDNPNGVEDEIVFDESDMISSHFIAGMLYAKILMREKLFG